MTQDKITSRGLDIKRALTQLQRANAKRIDALARAEGLLGLLLRAWEATGWQWYFCDERGRLLEDGSPRFWGEWSMLKPGHDMFEVSRQVAQRPAGSTVPYETPPMILAIERGERTAEAIWSGDLECWREELDCWFAIHTAFIHDPERKRWLCAWSDIGPINA